MALIVLDLSPVNIIQIKNKKVNNRHKIINFLLLIDLILNR